MHKTILLAGTAAFFAMAHAVHAADATYSDPQPMPAMVEDDLSERFSLTLGAGVGVAPSYEGSDEYRVFGYPIIAPSFGGEGVRRFEFRGLDDIRVHALYLGPLSLGPLVGYTFGRDEDDGDLLDGLGDIDGGLVAGGFVNYDFVSTPTARVGVAVSLASQVTNDFDFAIDNGFEIGTSLSAEITASERLDLTGAIGINYADGEYMNRYFGVSDGQAAGSAAAGVDLPAFSADSGFKDVYVQAGATYDLTENFDVRGTVGYSRLIGDAADSPVTADENQFFGTLGAAYTFRF